MKEAECLLFIKNLVNVTNCDIPKAVRKKQNREERFCKTEAEKLCRSSREQKWKKLQAHEWGSVTTLGSMEVLRWGSVMSLGSMGQQGQFDRKLSHWFKSVQQWFDGINTCSHAYPI